MVPVASDVEPVLFRLQNVYGPGQSLINPYTGIVSLFAQLAKAGEVIPVYEDGADHPRLRLHRRRRRRRRGRIAAAPRPTVDPWDIGSGEATSILRLAELIAAHYGAPAPRVTGQFRNGDVRAARDITAASAALGWAPQVWWRRASADSANGLTADRLSDQHTAMPGVAAPFQDELKNHLAGFKTFTARCTVHHFLANGKGKECWVIKGRPQGRAVTTRCFERRRVPSSGGMECRCNVRTSDSQLLQEIENRGVLIRGDSRTRSCGQLGYAQC